MPPDSASQIITTAPRPMELRSSSSRAVTVNTEQAVIPVPNGGEELPTEAANRAADPRTLAAAVSDLNEFIQNVRRDLHFSIDDDSGRTVIKVIDSESKELIRQIPPEEVLRLAKQLTDVGDGMILQVQV